MLAGGTNSCLGVLSLSLSSPVTCYCLWLRARKVDFINYAPANALHCTDALCDYPSFSSAAVAASPASGLSRRHGDYADERVCADINQLLFTQAGRCHIYLSDIQSVVGKRPICFVSDECERARGALQVHPDQLICCRHSDSRAAPSILSVHSNIS